jgi:hypothetical protein
LLAAAVVAGEITPVTIRPVVVVVVVVCIPQQMSPSLGIFLSPSVGVEPEDHRIQRDQILRDHKEGCPLLRLLQPAAVVVETVVEHHVHQQFKMERLELLVEAVEARHFIGLPIAPDQERLDLR